MQIQQLNQREETNDFDTGESSTDSDDVDDFSDDNLEDETEQESTGLQPQEVSCCLNMLMYITGQTFFSCTKDI